MHKHADENGLFFPGGNGWVGVWCSVLHEPGAAGDKRYTIPLRVTWGGLHAGLGRGLCAHTRGAGVGSEGAACACMFCGRREMMAPVVYLVAGANMTMVFVDGVYVPRPKGRLPTLHR